MLNLLDMLFTKRFCLPINSNVELYENGTRQIDSCLCGHYNHISCVLQNKGVIKSSRVLSVGMNQMGDVAGLKPGIHAEHDAINKLPQLKYKKRLEPINLLVVRLSGKNKLQSSKPCGNCINTMKNLPTKKGYKIQNIYYSDKDGHIVKTSLCNLDNESKHYSSFYRQRQIHTQ